MYVDMARLTWPEARRIGAQQPLGLIPTGSLEQHGPHLPLSTDVIMAGELARRVAGAIAEPVVVAPTIPAGLSTHHLAFPGTVTLPEPAFSSVITAYVEAFQGMGLSDVAIFSAHGGNFEFLRRYERAHLDTESKVRLATYHDLTEYIRAMHAGARRAGLEPVETDAHAGGVETSQMLAAFPELVRPFRDIVGFQMPFEGWMETLFKQGIASLSLNGVLGDLRSATAEAGVAITEDITSLLVGWISQSLGYTPITELTTTRA